MRANSRKSRTLIAFFATLLIASGAVAEDSQKKVIDGVVVMGLNRLFGEPV